MNITKINWNKHITQNSPRSGAFLQSYEWGEFQSTLKWRILKIIRIPNIGQLLKIKLPFGQNYLYLPKGPLKNYFKEIIKIAKKEKSLFVRFESKIENKHWSALKNFKKVPHSIPTTTILIDLKKSKEDLLKEMNQKTRYNIRLSEKKSLEIKDGGLDSFWKLTKETSTRQEIKSFSEDYYKKLLEIENFAYIKTVYFKNKPLASGLFIDFAKTTTYLFGASSNENKNLMAPYFLHWNIIKEAKNKGMEYCDFWGINPEDEKDLDYLKKWKGITKFKKGFGGETVSYSGTFEIPVKKGWYGLYRLAKLFR